MAQKLGFNVKGNKVSYIQNHKGGVVYGVAAQSPDDDFNLELGKAIAYARCDLMIRKRELYMAYEAKEMLQGSLEYDNNYNRFYKQYLEDVNRQITIMRKMTTNQKKMIKILCQDGAIIAGNMNYQQILNKTLRIVLDNIKYK